jgi:hypothetical protein
VQRLRGHLQMAPLWIRQCLFRALFLALPLLTPLQLKAGDFHLGLEQSTLTSDAFETGESQALRMEGSYVAAKGLISESDAFSLGGGFRTGSVAWTTNGVGRAGTFWGLPVHLRYRQGLQAAKLLIGLWILPTGQYATLSEAEIQVNGSSVKSSSVVTYQTSGTGYEVGGSFNLGSTKLGGSRTDFDLVFMMTTAKEKIVIKKVVAETSRDNVEESIGKSFDYEETIIYIGFGLLESGK